MQEGLASIRILTFDVFGTILDLAGSLAGPIQAFLSEVGSPLSASELWGRWRTRQRLEQYQDSLLLVGHSGYLETARRALLYVLRQASLPFTEQHVGRLMAAWRDLKPFPDVAEGLRRLKGRYRLVVLSNGERSFLDYLVAQRIAFPFDAVISVQEVGVFKPHPAVYRVAARLLGEEPYHLLMVSANSFDVMGARSCGYHGAWVNREGLPYEETPYRPDLTVKDFQDLAQALGC